MIQVQFASVPIAFILLSSWGYSVDCTLPKYVLANIPNEICSGEPWSGATTGVCLSSQQCSSVNGTAIGECAQGFGTCCSVTIDPCSPVINVTVNGTHLVGPSPSRLNGSFLLCYLLFPKQKDVCGVRLDLIKFEIAQPLSLTGNPGDCTDRAFFINSMTLDSGIPTSMRQEGLLCGNLTGQHAYLTNYDDPLTGGINFLLLRGTNQSWDIQVTFLKCDSHLLAPKKCLQYYTEITGSVKSLNYPYQQYNNMGYSICVKSHYGLRRITWRTCGGPLDFFTFGHPTDPPFAYRELRCGDGAQGGYDYISVYGDEKYCGNALWDPPPTSTAQPFLLYAHTDNTDGSGDLQNTGFCLIYSLST